jgi:hypothetical protein
MCDKMEGSGDSPTVSELTPAAASLVRLAGWKAPVQELGVAAL